MLISVDNKILNKLFLNLKTKNIVNYFVLMIVFFVSQNAFSQDDDQFIVFGKMKVDDGNFEFSKISILKDGARWKSIKGQKSFEFKLEYNHQYIFSFEKRGYVSKKIKVDTRISPELLEDGFDPFQFYVNIFKQYEGVNTVVYNQPVGVIRYDESIDDFGYDTDYTKSIRSQLNKVEEETEKAKKEEVIQQKEDNKQAELEQKQADAEAYKIAAEKEKQKKQVADAEKKRVAEEKARLAEDKEKAENEAKLKAAEDKAKIEADAAKKKAEAEATKLKAQEEARKKADADKAKLKAEEDARIKEAEKADKKKKELEAQLAASNKEDADKARAEIEKLKAEEEERKLASAEAEKKKKKIELEQLRAQELAEKNADKEKTRLIEEEQRRKMALAAAEQEKRRKLNAAFEEEERRVVDLPRTVHKEIDVQNNKTVTFITVSEGKEVNVYRKVDWSWGGVYYFKNSENISSSIFFQETK